MAKFCIELGPYTVDAAYPRGVQFAPEAPAATKRKSSSRKKTTTYALVSRKAKRKSSPRCVEKPRKRAAKKSTSRPKGKMVCPKVFAGRKVKRLASGGCMIKLPTGQARFVKKVPASARRGR